MCLVALSAGCNREQIADLILTVGFHPAFNPARTHLADKPGQGAVDSKRVLPYEQLLADMNEIHQVQHLARTSQADPERARKACDRIHEACERLLMDSTLGTSLRRQIREAEFAALQIATELDPVRFTKIQNAFRTSHFQSEPLEKDGGESSALRLLDEYLTASKLPVTFQFALNLHSVTYPKCSLNPQLFSTAVERLTNEKQFKVALQMASDGIRFCSSSAELPKLQAQFDRIVAEQPATPGLPFRLSGPTSEGSAVDIASFRGKVVVVTFWATWCPACREEMNSLGELYETYHQEGVEFVGVSLDDNHGELTQYVHANRLAWPHIFAARKGQTKWDNPIVQYYKVATIPFTIVVDRQGRIVQSGLQGEADIENTILDQLAH